MSAKPFIVILLLLSILEISCSAFSLLPTTPTPTLTPSPTSTPSPIPTRTLAPATPTSDFLAGLLPVGQPASEWNGIPVMPGALAGEADETSYVFTIESTPAEIQDYYDQELLKLGWNPFAAGQGGNGAMLLMYEQGEDLLTLSIIPHEDILLVMFVK